MTLWYAETPETIIAFITDAEACYDAVRHELCTELRDLCNLAATAGKRQIIDLRRVEYMGSAMAGMLLTTHKVAARLMLDLRLANVSPNFREILRITQLDRIFRFDDDRGPDLFAAAVPFPTIPGNAGSRVDRLDLERF